MKKLLFFILFFISVFSQGVKVEDTTKKTEPTQKPVVSQAVKAVSTSSKSIIVIDIKDRTQDLLDTYNSLKKDISLSKIVFTLYNGELITNVIQVDAAKNGTLLFLKISTAQGIKQISVFSEDILSIKAQ